MRRDELINAIFNAVREGKADKLTPMIDTRVLEVKGRELVVKGKRSFGSDFRVRQTYYIIFGAADVVQESEYVEPHQPHVLYYRFRITPRSPTVIVEPRLDMVWANDRIVTATPNTFYVFYDNEWCLVSISGKGGKEGAG